MWLSLLFKASVRHTHTLTNTNHTKVPLIISLLTRRLWDIKIQNFICLEVEKLLNCHRVQNPKKKPKPTPTPSPPAPPTTRLLLSRSLAVFKSCKSSVWPTLEVKKFCDSRVRRLVWLALPRPSPLTPCAVRSFVRLIDSSTKIHVNLHISNWNNSTITRTQRTHTDIWCIYVILFASASQERDPNTQIASPCKQSWENCERFPACDNRNLQTSSWCCLFWHLIKSNQRVALMRKYFIVSVLVSVPLSRFVSLTPLAA